MSLHGKLEALEALEALDVREQGFTGRRRGYVGQHLRVGRG